MFSSSKSKKSPLFSLSFGLPPERLHSTTPGSAAGPHPHHQPAASAWSLSQRAHRGQCQLKNPHTRQSALAHNTECSPSVAAINFPAIPRLCSEREHCPVHRLSPRLHLRGGHAEARDGRELDRHGEAPSLSSCQRTLR